MMKLLAFLTFLWITNIALSQNYKGLWKGEINDRQRKILNMLMDDFEGKLNTSKWAKIGKCSQDTALRDIQDLIEKGIMIKSEKGGRSTNYELNINKLITA